MTNGQSRVTDAPERALRAVAAVSAAYDIALGVSLLALRDALTTLLGTPPAVPPIHADLNGIFTIAIGVGYLLPLTDPRRYRAYLWLMGPGLKGAGALWFLVDHVWRGSPAAFLAFAVTDGLLAILTLWVLVITRPARGGPDASEGTSR